MYSRQGRICMCIKGPEERECDKFRELTVVYSGWSKMFKLRMGDVDEARRVKQGHGMNAL